MTAHSALNFRQNSLLATIAHAIWLVPDPLLAYERQWVASTYCVNDSMGCYGAAYEGPEAVLCAVFDENSPRNPLLGDDAGASDRHFVNLPRSLQSLMRATLQLMPSNPESGSPLVTAAFWEIEGELVGAEPWDELLEHGAQVFRQELMEPSDALIALQRSYELSDDAMRLIERLYRQRLASSSARVYLDVETWQAIARTGDGGVETCRRLLASIGVIAPASETDR